MTGDRAYRWREENRDRLGELLPDAVVVLPIGATEQHGPHLATATDALLAETVALRAADLATSRACRRPLVVVPTVPYGASDHHLPFGGTLSLRPETLLPVLLDLIRSVASGGGRRVLVVNGHGGNRGICSAAVAASAARHEGLVAGYLDYWSLLPDGAPEAATPGAAVPGHAGAFESSLVLAVEPSLVAVPRERRPASTVTMPPAASAVPGVEVARQGDWAAIAGYTDDPAGAEADLGKAWLAGMIEALADRMIDFANS